MNGMGGCIFKSLEEAYVFPFEMPYDWDSSVQPILKLRWYIDEAYATNNGELRWRIDYSG